MRASYQAALDAQLQTTNLERQQDKEAHQVVQQQLIWAAAYMGAEDLRWLTPIFPRLRERYGQSPERITVSLRGNVTYSGDGAGWGGLNGTCSGV